MTVKTNNVIGSIQSIWQYPVKSMNGVKLDRARILSGGLLGDRCYALIDQIDRKIASAKYPKKWGKLLELKAAFVTQPEQPESLPAVRITSSTGLDILSTDKNADDLLSDFLARPVRLSAQRPDTISLDRLDPLESEEIILDIGDLMLKNKFSDYAEVHLLTTSTLQELSSLSPDVQFDERRFRPNFVIETLSGITGFAENDWVGRTLTIGSDVQLTISDPTPRCAIPTLGNGGLLKDPNVLKTIVNHNMLEVPLLENKVLPCAGVYAFLGRSGGVYIGDPVTLY